MLLTEVLAQNWFMDEVETRLFGFEVDRYGYPLVVDTQNATELSCGS